eukprot:gnl/MRDRNA2_/MRDRNA2_181683_c0_seq1.p1 gnl/MRDRNA2_/MRDRNA2_181683_c0~~gnl/MRDRNA2_/MRDRNA2_181683_c0_seq1.p1  ORF type:complete len:295 (+),score=59.05 gnl/MRDRNA2_/MRDRNA2_181683_c0_seq1:54-938(+)
MAEKKKSVKSVLTTFASGGIAGASEICVTMPLDTIKTQMQFGGGKGMTETTKAILAQRGVGGLYYGMSAMLAQVSMKAAIRFAAFDAVSGAMKSASPDMHKSQLNFLSGIAAGVIESAVWVTPTERMKVLRQAEINSATPKYTTLLGGMKTVIREQGPQGLFVGFLPTAVRNGGAVGVRFMLYDDIKKLICGDKKATPFQSLAAGCATGTISSLLNQPIDTAKSRIQSQGKAVEGTKLKYNGLVSTLMVTAKEEGLMSWYRGSAPRVMRLTIGQGVIFSVQEHISQVLKKLIGT